MKLIKAAFILAIAAFLMPTPPGPEIADAQHPRAETGSTIHLIAAAGEAMDDVSDFCTRRPTVCATAWHLFRTFEAKTKYGFRLLYEWANEQPADDQLPYPYRDQAALGDLAAKVTAGKEIRRSSTLTIDDIVPEWRGPKPPRSG